MISNDTFQALSYEEGVRQSVSTILTTPKGTRTMNREFGSDAFKLVDAGISPGTLLEISAAVGEALARWEKRVRFERLRLLDASEGRMTLQVEFQILSIDESSSVAINL